MLINSFHSAVSAKVKVMYGNRIKSEDYSKLLKKKYVSEIVAFLADSSGYEKAFSQLDPRYIHRNHIELILKKELYNDYLKLIRFSQKGDKRLLQLLFTKYEIDELLSFLRYLKSERAKDFILTAPKYIIENSNIDFNALSKSKSFEEFLNNIKNTAYYKILKKCDFNSNDAFSKCESMLYSNFYACAFKIAKEQSGDIHKSIKAFIGMRVDMLNIIYILRLKKYYKSDSEEIRIHIIPYNYKISKTVLNEMITAKDTDSVFEIISKTYYGKYFKSQKIAFADEYLYRLMYEISKKNITYGAPSVLIPISYLTLKEIEIKDLITITEGKRYSLSNEEINRSLIGKEENTKQVI
ncbi:MAG: hypothetical protein E7480_02025 [Ruminococcaceae bacterium]|nr:hypothetical protein [Oscillospiraceae bacterium]